MPQTKPHFSVNNGASFFSLFSFKKHTLPLNSREEQISHICVCSSLHPRFTFLTVTKAVFVFFGFQRENVNVMSVIKHCMNTHTMEARLSSTCRKTSLPGDGCWSTFSVGVGNRNRLRSFDSQLEPHFLF